MPDVAVRRLVREDAAGLAGAVAAGQRHDEFRASSDPDGSFIGKAFEVDPTIFGGAFADGNLVGLVSSEFKFTLVAPPFRRQGIGRRLIDLAEAMERDRGRPNVLMGCLPSDAPGHAFLSAVGFTFHSTLWDLALDPATSVAGPGWPPGIEARSFDVTRDVEAWVRLFNAAFAEHATPLQLDPAFVAAGIDDPTVDDADTQVLVDRASGAMVGFCATSPTRTDGRVGERGEIWTIGVDPERRGQGLGRQLLRWGVQHLRSLGVVDVVLSVNDRNDRAVGLYEAEGFRRVRTRERWARPVAPVGVGR